MAVQNIKKKRVSKKLKISWRKHVDIGDVEEFLEEKRLEERLGPLSTYTNDELFKVDTGPVEPILSAKQRKLVRLSKPIKCFSALQPHTKVPDPIAKRNRVRTKEERKSSILKNNDLRNKLGGILKQKEIQSMQDRKLAELKRQNRRKRGEFNADIWESEIKVVAELNNEWVTSNTKKHNLRGTGIPQKNVLPSIKEKKSILPSVEAPHPGMSYNPSYADHQDLMKIVVDKESKIIKKEEHLTRVTRGMFSKVTEAKRDSAWLVEMSEGLPSKENLKVEQDETDDNEYKTVNPPVKNSKKSVKQRRKQKEQRALLLVRRAKKMEKKKITDIHQLKIIHKEIEKSAKKQNVLRELRKKKDALKETDVKRLGSIKFEEPDLEFNVGSDIAGNLRNLKKEGNLLASRFKSLQKRNILQPSTKRVRKNAKVKRYTKPGHKEDWKQTIAREM